MWFIRWKINQDISFESVGFKKPEQAGTYAAYFREILFLHHKLGHMDSRFRLNNIPTSLDVSYKIINK